MNEFPLLKTVCFPNTLFKATPQKQWKFVFFDKFRLTALLLLLRTAKCKNHNVEVQTIKWYKSFFALPSTHNSEHNCVKNLLKYPSPVTARNPDDQKFVPPSSSTKMWPAYVSLHKVFPFHLKIRCTVEFSLAMCVTSVTKL